MNKLRHTVNAIALLCLIVGAVVIGVGFFMGSSPVTIQNHGNLTEYFQRLETNWSVLCGDVRTILSIFGVTI